MHVTLFSYMMVDFSIEYSSQVEVLHRANEELGFPRQWGKVCVMRWLESS